MRQGAAAACDREIANQAKDFHHKSARVLG
jgi:hypothetical protein